MTEPAKKREPRPDEDQAAVLVAIKKLQLDLAEAIGEGRLKLTPADLRNIVDGYYFAQEARKRLANQAGAAERSKESAHLTEFFAWQFERFEKQMHGALLAWCKRDPVCVWAMSQHGVGPVIAAGLRAHIDITKAPTVGHIWRFAGMEPTIDWLGKEKAKALVDSVMGKEKTITLAHWAEIERRTHRRAENIRRLMMKIYEKPTRENLIKTLARRPYNADLKTLLWKAGDCFVKVSGGDKSIYGLMYRARKGIEIEKNEAGEFAEQAAGSLQRVGKSTESHKWNKKGLLSPGHIDARARRWAVKQFISHWHEIAYKHHYKKDPPNPYPIQHLGHVHWHRAKEAAEEEE